MKFSPAFKLKGHRKPGMVTKLVNANTAETKEDMSLKAA
jgi:hypothetical protein